MFSKYLSSIEGVAYYPIIALAIFLPVFVGAALWAFKVKSDYIKKMESMPFHDNELNKGNFNEQ